MPESYLEKLAMMLIDEAGLPKPIREYRFCPERKWRCDFCWIDQKVVCEVEGGIWSKGRHSRGGFGFLADCEKYNELALRGFLLIRATKEHLVSGKAVEWLKRALNGIHENKGD